MYSQHMTTRHLYFFQALARFQEVTNRYTQEKQAVSLHFEIPS